MNAIYMSDLAQQYFPNSTPRSATSQLHRWISTESRTYRKTGGIALRIQAKGIDTVAA